MQSEWVQRLKGSWRHGRKSNSLMLRVGGIRPGRTRTLSIAAFVGVLVTDLVAKEWAASAVTDPVRIADWLYLMLHRNAGLFLGTVPVSTWYWVGVCTAFGWFGWRTLSVTSTPVAVCLAVVLAGVTGNAFGHARGAVVDFIGVGPISGEMWLVMNVADLAMVAGALALAFILVSGRMRRARPHASAR